MCLYEKVDHHGTIISQNAPKYTFPSFKWGGLPPNHTLPPPPPRLRRVEGAEEPYYIALTATQFHSPSTSKFGENPVTLVRVILLEILK